MSLAPVDMLEGRRTFRDPAGSLELRVEGVYREVGAAYAEDVAAFLQSSIGDKLVSEGLLVSSEVLPHDGTGLLLKHPRIPFISYPWEWPVSLWLSAGELTIDLCIRLISAGWILKDATPLNVLFRGTSPVFVDVLSVERWDGRSFVWRPYGQFIRTFLLPLIAHSQLGWPLAATRLRRDGFEPEEIYSALPWMRRLQNPGRGYVVLPILVARIATTVFRQKPSYSRGDIVAQRLADPEISRQVLLRRLKKLRSALLQAAPAKGTSAWSDYGTGAFHYSDGEQDEKVRFVAEALEQASPEWVLDVGCNTGRYSRMAADGGADVVAIDTDLQALARLCEAIRGTSARILPLYVDLAYPSPALGWKNQENLSFLDRCDGRFDMVLMLAVIHHLLLSSQIPMEEIAALCSRLTTRHLVLEWVPPGDPKFIEILRGREAIYGHITESSMRSAFERYFSVEAETTLSNGRILLHLVKR